MQAEDIEDLKKLLQKLNTHSSHFIVEGGGLYCQFEKTEKDNVIGFECVSHFANKNVDPNLQRTLEKLGFKLITGENYRKNVILNSEFDINNTAKEVAYIFEEIYKIPETCEYESDDQIETPDESSKTNAKIQKNQVSPVGGTGNVLTVIMLVMGAGVLVYYLGTSEPKKPPLIESSTPVESYSVATPSVQGPKYLLSSPEVFRENFNDFSRSYNLGLNIRRLKFEYGDAVNTFTYSFNKYMGIFGVMKLQDNSLETVSLIAQGNGNLVSGVDIIAGMACIIGSVDQSLTAQQRQEIIQALGILQEGADIYNLSAKTIKNGFQYYIISSPATGINFGVEIPQ